MYFNRLIDSKLLQWKNDSEHKPLLLRGARQVGKSRAVKHLDYAIRTSLEHFGQLEYTEEQNNSAVRHVDIYPLYALSQIR